MKIEFFEKPMCCPTGICGPSVDETLVKLQENIKTLQQTHDSLQVERYQPQTHGLIFMAAKDVAQFVKEEKMNALPITKVNGVIVKKGEYPTLEELDKALRGE